MSGFFGMTDTGVQLMEFCAERAKTDPLYAIAYALLQNAEATYRLGNGGAATQMGGLEGLGDAIGTAIREGLSDVAAALEALEPKEP